MKASYILVTDTNDWIASLEDITKEELEKELIWWSTNYENIFAYQVNTISEPEAQLTENEGLNTMKMFRRHRVQLLTYLCKYADDICGGDDNLEYDFDTVPAHPELYSKDDWEATNFSIEELVLNNIIPELKRAIESYHPADFEFRVLNDIYALIDSIDWSEI